MTRQAVEGADAISRFAARVRLTCAGLGAAVVVTSPLWAWGRPDRALGFLLGAAASVMRLAWTLRLARGLAESTASRYAAARLASLLPLAAALLAAGVLDGIDLPAAGAGVFFATAATILASAFEVRAAARGVGSGRGPPACAGEPHADRDGAARDEAS